ncbi:MAG: DEAD/DEAH box helicase, partial [Coprobacillus sp.]
GITFEVKELKGNQFAESVNREKRKSKEWKQTDLEKKITSIVRKPAKVKPGYKKKRKRVIESMVKQEKRSIIQQDIRKQKKARAKQAQIEKREREAKD